MDDGASIETKPSAPLSQAELDVLTDQLIEKLKTVYDPEIPVDIYELGLIYDIDISEDGDAVITMTLTTPHCPVAESMPGEVEMRASAVPGVRDAQGHLNLGVRVRDLPITAEAVVSAIDREGAR